MSLFEVALLFLMFNIQYAKKEEVMIVKNKVLEETIFIYIDEITWKNESMNQHYTEKKQQAYIIEQSMFFPLSNALPIGI